MDAVDLADVGAQLRPGKLVASLADQVQIDVAERGPEAVRVLLDDGFVPALDHQVVLRHGRAGQDARPHVEVLAFQAGLTPWPPSNDSGGVTVKDAKAHLAAVDVRPKNRMRVVMVAAADPGELAHLDELEVG